MKLHPTGKCRFPTTVHRTVDAVYTDARPDGDQYMSKVKNNLRSRSELGRTWIPGLALLLFAALVASMLIASTTAPGAFNSSAQGETSEATHTHTPTPDPDIPPDVDGPAGQSSTIGSFTASGSFVYLTEGDFRYQWKHSMNWTEPSCDGCTIRGYRTRFFLPSGWRYYSVWVDDSELTDVGYLDDNYVAEIGTGRYSAYIRAYADNGEYRDSNVVYFNVIHIPATRTPTPTRTPTGTFEPVDTATPTPTDTPCPPRSGASQVEYGDGEDTVPSPSDAVGQTGAPTNQQV